MGSLKGLFMKAIAEKSDNTSCGMKTKEKREILLRNLILLHSDWSKIDHFDLPNNLNPFLKGREVVK